MQPNIYTTAAKRVTKLTDKAKAAIEDKLEAAAPSKKWKIDAAKGASAVSSNPKKAKPTPPTGTPKDRPVSAEASSSPPDMGTGPATGPAPCKNCRAVVRTEEEEALLHNDPIIVDDEHEKSENENSNQSPGPESAEDERSMFLIHDKNATN
jgi:hypothetical protein